MKTGWQVHALCLMGNHFHLVVETPQGNLVAGMKWFLGTYTSRFNRRGWCLGEPAFKQELLEQMAGGFGGHHGGPERAESAAVGAERWVGAELQRLGWDATELQRRRKGDPGKVRLARRLRRETTTCLPAGR